MSRISETRPRTYDHLTVAKQSKCLLHSNSRDTGFWEVGVAEARNSNPEENQGGRSNVGAERGTLERNLLSALASRLVEGTLTFIDGIGGFRGFGGFRTVPIL